jgi:lipopolysaccharide export system protein LptA
VKRIHQRLLNSLLIFIGIFIFTFSSWALRSDQNKPTNFTADKVDFNDVNQEYFLTGHVVIKRGSIVVKGDKAVVVVDPDGFQKISILGNDRQLAEFTQQLDGPTLEFIYGEGELILYEEKNDELLISGQAYTVRTAGEVWRDKLIADQIQYNLFTEKYQAVTKDTKNLSRSFLSPKFVESPKLLDAKSPYVNR